MCDFRTVFEKNYGATLIAISGDILRGTLIYLPEVNLSLIFCPVGRRIVFDGFVFYWLKT